MLTVAIVDSHAEARVRLANGITRTLSEPGPDLHLLPRISVIPLAPQELKFHATPHVVIIGPGLIEQEITTVSLIRSQLADVKILALVPSDRHRIGSVEHLIRLGADDVIDAQASGRELLTRLVLLARRVERAKGGKLILVEGVKGGVGATSLTAAFAEMLAQREKDVVVVDGDGMNRCLSRFLKCRPLINENLQLILDGLRSSTPEFVAQTRTAVAAGEYDIGCVAPPSSEERWSDPDGSWIRNFMSSLEVLDEAVDYVLVDVARLSGSVREALYGAADGILFVATQDPACLPAVVERIKSCSAQIGPDVAISIVRNERDRDGISGSVWQRELKRIKDIPQVKQISAVVPYVAAASRWPVSGSTLVSLGTTAMRASLQLALDTAIGEQPAKEQGSLWKASIAHIAKRFALKTPGTLSAIDRGARDLSAQELLTNAIALPATESASATLTPVKQIDFFVSAPSFDAEHRAHVRRESADDSGGEAEEILVSPARMSAA